MRCSRSYPMSAAGLILLLSTFSAHADDTAALQELIDAGNGAVRLESRTYRISEPIVVKLDKIGPVSISGGGTARIVMAGPGPALRLTGTHFKSAAPEGFAEGVWERERMPLVDGVAIVGEHPDADGIEAAGTMQLTISRVHIRGVRHGIRLVENNRNVIISDCHIYENRGIGIYYDDVNLHQSNITGCHISYNDGGGIVSRAGNVRNIHITGCDIESNMSPESPPTANVLIDCRESDYGTAEVAITGCTIQHNNPSPGSANIRMLGRSKDKDGQAVREGNVTITGNVLSDVKVNVHLKDCRGVTVTGNTFWQGYEHNLLLEHCRSVVVGANNLDRNPRYDYGNTQEANNAILLKGCRDCTITGLHVTGVWRAAAGVLVENCSRINITNCTILDCDNVGLFLINVTDSRVSDCLIRDDRDDANSISLKAMGGSGNHIADNLLGTPPDIGDGTVDAAPTLQD
jgi:parallel beta-helix repeat protein